jgi:spore coat polysaccharide biosynthesis protein SpsF
MNYKTEQEQEQFWAGQFGNDYIERNNYDLLPTSTEATRRQFRTLSAIRSVIEIDPNIGLNLVAINSLMPDTKLAAIEINGAAVKRLKELQVVTELYGDSILDFEPTKTYDVVLLVGILQHINPEQLTVVYDKIYSMSKRFIIVSDYFSPTPTLRYRGLRCRQQAPHRSPVRPQPCALAYKGLKILPQLQWLKSDISLFVS